MNKEIESHGFYCFMGVVFKMSVWEKQRHVYMVVMDNMNVLNAPTLYLKCLKQ